MKLTINFLAFLAGWFGSVLGAAAGLPWVGPVIVLMVATLHLTIVPQPGKELRLLLSALLIGAVLDSLAAALGWLSFDTGVVVEGLAPYWMVAMWVGFATTLNTCMRWLRDYPVVAFFLGLVGAPIIYAFGAKLGALTLSTDPLALLGLGLSWGIALPVLYRLAARFDGTLTPTGTLPAHLAAP